MFSGDMLSYSLSTLSFYRLPFFVIMMVVICFVRLIVGLQSSWTSLPTRHARRLRGLLVVWLFRFGCKAEEIEIDGIKVSDVEIFSPFNCDMHTCARSTWFAWRNSSRRRKSQSAGRTGRCQETSHRSMLYSEDRMGQSARQSFYRMEHNVMCILLIICWFYLMLQTIVT